MRSEQPRRRTCSGERVSEMRGVDHWCNRSVLMFASGKDPFAMMRETARNVSLEAIQKGWSGPPFDPFELAKLLGIEIVPRSDILDAQIIPIADERFVIEFNPNRPFGRIRYSICHEIAHTFFQDCRERIRHRGVSHDAGPNGWELELLCNLGAAELLMPIGSLRDLQAELDISIDRVLQLRSRFDVSTEALLLRLVELTSFPVAVFAASVRSGTAEGNYRVDYVECSRAWDEQLEINRSISKSSALHRCSAIGFTSKDILPSAGIAVPLVVECVGLPPFSGSAVPRVVGLVKPGEASVASQQRIQFLRGDALVPFDPSPTTLAQVVNDQTPNWGGGFAKEVSRRMPAVQCDFRQWWIGNPQNRALGQARICEASASCWVASLIAQRGYGPSDSPRIRYSALEEALGRLRDHATAVSASVQMPRIGAGQAGGSWPVIEEMIDRHLVRQGLTVRVYDLPPGRAGRNVLRRTSVTR